jgi:hypothetical protein
MAANKPQPTLADYVAIALSPALIIALVGSLVFFLLEVLYVGHYQGRMQWILFLFVFAAVLIARMSMMDGVAERAPLYGLVLGVGVWLGLQKFVEFPPGTPLADYSWAVNLGLLALIWWCSHRGLHLHRRERGRVGAIAIPPAEQTGRGAGGITVVHFSGGLGLRRCYRSAFEPGQNAGRMHPGDPRSPIS